MRAEKTMDRVSRADLVRQRRSQNSQQRVSRTRQNAAHPVPSQPVIVRGTNPFAARPLKNSTQSRVRRQYYYSLGATGAEVRLPAVPFFRPDWRMLSGLLAVLLLLALYALTSAPQFQVNEIDVQGIQRLTASDIEAVLELKGSQIIQFNPTAAKQALAAAFPELTNISIKVGLPAHVVIQVTERVPVVSWNLADRSYWIDAQGYILPPRGEVTDLLQLTTNGLPSLLPLAETEQVETASDVTKTASAAALPEAIAVWGRQIDPTIVSSLIDLRTRIPAESNLVYHTYNGLGWKDPGGWDVFIGKDLSNFDLKIRMYQEILTQLEQQGILPTQMVSVEYLNAPFYK